MDGDKNTDQSKVQQTAPDESTMLSTDEVKKTDESDVKQTDPDEDQKTDVAQLRKTFQLTQKSQQRIIRSDVTKIEQTAQPTTLSMDEVNKTESSSNADVDSSTVKQTSQDELPKIDVSQLKKSSGLSIKGPVQLKRSNIPHIRPKSSPKDEAQKSDVSKVKQPIQPTSISKDNDQKANVSLSKQSTQPTSKSKDNDKTSDISQVKQTTKPSPIPTKGQQLSQPSTGKSKQSAQPTSKSKDNNKKSDISQVKQTIKPTSPIPTKGQQQSEPSTGKINPSLAQQHKQQHQQYTKFPFNSNTIRGRANVAKATYAFIATTFILYKLTRRKKAEVVNDKQTTSGK